MTDGVTGGAGRLQTVIRRTVGPLFRRCFEIEVRGLDRVPESGGAIIAANHTSALDSFIVASILARNISYVGKAEYLDNWKTRRVFPALGMIPIDRSGGDAAQAAFDVAAEILDAGELFGIYPEGTRSRTGLLYKGRTGVARLSYRTGAPIIPVGLQGMRDIQPPDASLPKLFAHCTIAFGEPLYPGDYGDPAVDPLAYRSMTDVLMFRIRHLSGQKYINRYAPSAGRLEAPGPVEYVIDATDKRTTSDLLSV